VSTREFSKVAENLKGDAKGLAEYAYQQCCKVQYRHDEEAPLIIEKAIEAAVAYHMAGPGEPVSENRYQIRSLVSGQELGIYTAVDQEGAFDAHARDAGYADAAAANEACGGSRGLEAVRLEDSYGGASSFRRAIESTLILRLRDIEKFARHAADQGHGAAPVAAAVLVHMAREVTRLAVACAEDIGRLDAVIALEIDGAGE
jgi:hypothetical protein